MSKRLCVRCHKPDSTLVCRVCELQIYCGNACADDDWRAHHIEAHCGEGVRCADLVLERELPTWRGDIYVGGIEALSDAELMGKIGAVVSCIVPTGDDEMDLMEEKLGKRAHFMVPVWDNVTAPIEHYWPCAAHFIDEHIRAGHSVLVHCHAGKSRSVSTTIYYMLHKRLGFDSATDALDHIQRARPIAHPNAGFMKKLTM